MGATINGTTFSDTVDNTAGARYLPSGQLSISGKQYDISRISSPGADGTLPKNYGFRSARVNGIVAFVEGTPEAAVAAAEAFGDGLAPNDFSATIGGTAMAFCGNASVVPGMNEVLSVAGTLCGVCYAHVSFDWVRTA